MSTPKSVSGVGLNRHKHTSLGGVAVKTMAEKNWAGQSGCELVSLVKIQHAGDGALQFFFFGNRTDLTFYYCNSICNKRLERLYIRGFVEEVMLTLSMFGVRLMEVKKPQLRKV